VHSSASLMLRRTGSRCSPITLRETAVAIELGERLVAKVLADPNAIARTGTDRSLGKGNAGTPRVQGRRSYSRRRASLPSRESQPSSQVRLAGFRR
jgi:hypothetical protein